MYGIGKSATEIRPNTVYLTYVPGTGDYNIQYEHEFKFPKYS